MTSFLSFSWANIKCNETGVARKCNSLSRQKYGSSSSIVPDLWAPKNPQNRITTPQVFWLEPLMRRLESRLCLRWHIDQLYVLRRHRASQAEARELIKHF